MTAIVGEVFFVGSEETSSTDDGFDPKGDGFEVACFFGCKHIVGIDEGPHAFVVVVTCVGLLWPEAYNTKRYNRDGLDNLGFFTCGNNSGEHSKGKTKIVCFEGNLVDGEGVNITCVGVEFLGEKVGADGFGKVVCPLLPLLCFLWEA